MQFNFYTHYKCRHHTTLHEARCEMVKSSRVVGDCILKLLIRTHITPTKMREGETWEEICRDLANIMSFLAILHLALMQLIAFGAGVGTQLVSRSVSW